MSDIVPIVDDDDKIIDYIKREKLGGGNIYRVAALWLTNSRGQILLAQRALDKKHHPGKWGPAVAGTVEKDESYDANIIKEAQEELGLRDLTFDKGPKELNQGTYNHFTQWYTLVLDREVANFKIDHGEVADICWFSRQEIEEKITNEPDFFTPNFPHYFNLFK